MCQHWVVEWNQDIKIKASGMCQTRYKERGETMSYRTAAGWEVWAPEKRPKMGRVQETDFSMTGLHKTWCYGNNH